MDNQGQNLNQNQPLTKPDSNPIQNQNPYTSLDTKPALIDTDAQTLLTVSNLEGAKPPKHSKLFLIAMAVVVLAVIATALFTSGHSSKNTSSNSNVSLPNSNNPLNNNGSINQQVKYCSNIVNANTVC